MSESKMKKRGSTRKGEKEWVQREKCKEEA